MATVYASIRLLPDEYALFLRDIPNDYRLPPSYIDWSKRVMEEDAQHVANGEEIQEVIIKYESFASYCRSYGLKPSYEIIRHIATGIGFALRASRGKP